jgi:hypothetical protein
VDRRHVLVVRVKLEMALESTFHWAPKDIVLMRYFGKLAPAIGAVAIATFSVCFSPAAPNRGVAVAADKEETPGEVIAVQIRTQGFACKPPVSAKRDTEYSTPGDAVWLLQCKTEKYRVRLIPDMAAKVERLE